MPHASASDDVFDRFLIDGEYVISPEQTQSNPIPLRSRPPGSLAHIHHCVAVNALLVGSELIYMVILYSLSGAFNALGRKISERKDVKSNKCNGCSRCASGESLVTNV